MISEALYEKYSATQVYYYTSDINDILNHERSAAVELFKDMLIFDDVDEFLKRYYKRSEYKNKIKLLTEYYKYHNDIARLFMKPQRDTIIKFHDNKRRVEFKILKDEIGEDQFEGDSANSSESKHKLKKLTVPKKDKWSKPLLKGVKFLKKEKDKYDRLLRGVKTPFEEKSFNSKDTIFYLNLKLGYAISDTVNDSQYKTHTATLTNLSKFLNFIKSKSKLKPKIMQIGSSKTNVKSIPSKKLRKDFKKQEFFSNKNK